MWRGRKQRRGREVRKTRRKDRTKPGKGREKKEDMEKLIEDWKEQGVIINTVEGIIKKVETKLVEFGNFKESWRKERNIIYLEKSQRGFKTIEFLWNIREM